jgi:hypothetical protein
MKKMKEWTEKMGCTYGRRGNIKKNFEYEEPHVKLSMDDLVYFLFKFLEVR